MVAVLVRDQHGIDGVEVDLDQLETAPDRTDAGAQDGIGQQPQAGRLEQDRRMAEPGDARHSDRLASCRCHAR